MTKSASLILMLAFLFSIHGGIGKNVDRDRQMLLGVNMHPLQTVYGPETMPQQVRLAKSLGAAVISFDIHWAWLDPNHTPVSGWDAVQLDRIDAFLAQVRNTNIMIAALVTETPCWASSDPEKDCVLGHYDWRYPPENPEDFADFLEVLVSLYKDDINYWIIWGEPNTPYRWVEPDPVAYTDLLKAAYPAIKDVDPDAKVVTGSLAPVDGGGETLSVFDYLAGMYASGAGDYFDLLAYNPYTDGNPPDWYNPTFPAVSFSHSVPMIREIMLANGDSSPIWLTEVGWSTVSESCVNCWVDTLPTTEAEQAEYLENAITIAQDWPYVEALLVYELVDMLVVDSQEQNLEYYFGLFRRDFSPKPAAAAFSAHTLPFRMFLPLLIRAQ
jgi:polysaccharide biosynthesis protein PslG